MLQPPSPARWSARGDRRAEFPARRGHRHRRWVLSGRPLRHRRGRGAPPVCPFNPARDQSRRQRRLRDRARRGLERLCAVRRGRRSPHPHDRRARPLRSRGYPQSGILFSDNALMDASGVKETLFPLGVDGVRCFSGLEFQRFLKRSFFYIATSTVWFRTEALRRLGGFDERLRWHSDFFAAYALGLWQGATYVPDAVSYFRVSAGSYSAARRDRREQEQVLRAWLAKTAEPAIWPQRRAFRDCGLLPVYGRQVLAALRADPGYVTPTLVLRLLTRGLYDLVRPVLPLGWRRWLRRLSSGRGVSFR